MKHVTRAQWTAALRSGEYKQGQSRLYSVTSEGEKFCCLGVLGILAGAKKITGDRPDTAIALSFGELGLYYHSTDFVPNEIAELVGLNYSHQVDLANMNDSGATFAEIADFIDQLPEHTPTEWQNCWNVK